MINAWSWSLTGCKGHLWAMIAPVRACRQCAAHAPAGMELLDACNAQRTWADLSVAARHILFDAALLMPATDCMGLSMAAGSADQWLQ